MMFPLSKIAGRIVAKHSPQCAENNLIVQISTAFFLNCSKIVTPGTNSGKVEPFRGVVSVSFPHGSFLNQVVAVREIAVQFCNGQQSSPPPLRVEAEGYGQ